MTVNLVEFLRARLDEDERIARAVRVPHDWHQGPGDDDPEWVGDEMVLMWPPEFHTPYEQDKHWRGLTVEGSELAAHIAAHDPARVLREVEAKRKLVAAFDSAVVAYGAAEQGTAVSERMGGSVNSLRYALQLVALAYADHPGYKEEWSRE